MRAEKEHYIGTHKNSKAIFLVYFHTNLLKILLGWIRIRIFKLLDTDPHWEEQLDPDPQKINADPQPWFKEMVSREKFADHCFGQKETPYLYIIIW